MGCSKIMWFLHFLDDGFLILKVKCNISRDFMTFAVGFQFLGGFGAGIAFWDARPMKMMIIVPFYSALGGFGIMLKTFVSHWFYQVWRRVLRPRNGHVDGF